MTKTSKKTNKNNVDEALEDIQKLLGERGYINDADAMEPYLKSWRGGRTGKAILIALPNSTKQTSQLVVLCNKHNIAIVPQGGNTGLVSGAIPTTQKEERPQIVICMKRMQKIRSVDIENDCIIAEAGCSLATLQTEAEKNNRLFPLSMASEGSCQVGGFVSTNAGGTAVIRYGNTRHLVLGLEVILPDGTILSELKSLRKDNTGYDLKQFFIGAEGTLGIVTAACLTLAPQPKQTVTAYIAVPNIISAQHLLVRFKEACGDAVTMFELISDHAQQLVLDNIPNTQAPLTSFTPYYVLVELASPIAGDYLRTACEGILEVSFNDGMINDASIAQSLTQTKNFRKIRENISEAESKSGRGIHFDISVPIACVANFITQTDAMISKNLEEAQIIAFGHMGDGNIHYNVLLPKDSSNVWYEACKKKLKNIIYQSLGEFDGSISAEHGIGQDRRNDLQDVREENSLELMRSIKTAIDPKNIMNPGKML